MQRDFGPGLTIDDLIGLPAEQLMALSLPNETIFDSIARSAAMLTDRQKGNFLLMELWGDGYSVWQGRDENEVLQITPTGRVVPIDWEI
ncbi:MAG: hypothetical protein SVR81_04420 [Chloroflexota bacterium]|nr:hypothetical protein [Chloroflexota bacterium]